MTSSSSSSSFLYDDVPYDNEANADTHPIAMATLAKLAGVSAASVTNARVLEIGCGDGTNLVRMATYLPHAQFVGFDLSKAAIAAACSEATRPNVKLFAADIMDVGSGQQIEGDFDFVIAHGMVSWVPAPVRAKLLSLMRDLLRPNGIGFVSVNALPGWELRRALREIALLATRGIEEPAKKVKGALDAITQLAASKVADGFGHVLAIAAREYLDHVTKATPPRAAFSRYVFHDLLAEVNIPFSRADLATDLERAGLTIVSDTPLLPNEAARTASPFLQVLVARSDRPSSPSPDATNAIADMHLWADFTPSGRAGEFKMTSGALLRPTHADGLARAIAHAPGFVKVRDLIDDPSALGAFSDQLLLGLKEGVFTLVVEPPPNVDVTKTTPGDHHPPRFAADVERVIAEAVAKAAPSAVLTNALHRSYRVPLAELKLLLEAGSDERLRDRFRRHLFFVRDEARER